jgi:glutamine amidotransferase
MNFSGDMKIAIIDYGAGNPASVLNMLKKIGVEAYVSHLPGDLSQAQKLILPGVGSFDYGMSQLKKNGLIPVLNHLVLEQKRPILGICLGMQLMTNRSEEGSESGLGWVDAETLKFSFEQNKRLRIPHMGWNNAVAKKSNLLFDSQEPEERFYFVHSYHVVCHNGHDILTKTSYGIEFVSSFQSQNIVGVQFHPEKSHRFGCSFLKCFAEDFN